MISGYILTSGYVKRLYKLTLLIDLNVYQVLMFSIQNTVFFDMASASGQ